MFPIRNVPKVSASLKSNINYTELHIENISNKNISDTNYTELYFENISDREHPHSKTLILLEHSSPGIFLLDSIPPTLTLDYF